MKKTNLFTNKSFYIIIHSIWDEKEKSLYNEIKMRKKLCIKITSI